MIRFYNSLTRRQEPFEPLEPGRVGMYTCGPTVYDFAHIGNFRAYVWEDLLRRFLLYRGFEVVQVMNLTDVDDKTIRRSLEEGVELDVCTAPYIEAFFEDLDTLGIQRAEHYPRATRHVDEMVEMVQALRERGHTYDSQGSIYFKIDTFPGYGKLSHLDAEGLKPGARIDSDEYDKEDVRDFVLWKAETPGEPAWDTALGRGRPGWHLECSAMSAKYLGVPFDIHTGGIDNMFPHHENEIAQSEAALGKPFVRTWLHCAHLIVDGEKMSKSKGNFYTLRDLLAQGHSARAVRYQLLSAHYRSQLNFTQEGLQQAKAALGRLDDLAHRLQNGTTEATTDSLVDKVAAAEERFGAALDDDLNTSAALAALFDLVRDVHTAYDRDEVSANDRNAVEAFLGRADGVLGFLQDEGAEEIDPRVEELARKRQEARAAKDYATADRLRDEIAAAGYVLEDSPDGFRLKRA